MGGIRSVRLYWMDYLRFFGCILIIFFHFNLFSPNIEISGAVVPIYTIFGINMGGLGVALFFLLSGAALMYVYGREDKLNISRYLKRRIIDIYPQYWCGFLIALCLVVLWGTVPRAPLWTLVLSFFGLDGYLGQLPAPFSPNFYLVGEWYLGCQLIMYVLFPVLLICVRRGPWITLVCSLAVSVIGMWVAPNYPGVLGNFAQNTHWLLTSHLPEFVFGMVLILRWEQFPKRLLIFGSISFFAVTSFIFPGPGDNSIPYVLEWTLAASACAICIRCLAERLSFTKNNEAIVRLQSYCFPAFLVHHFILDRVFTLFSALGPMGLRREIEALLLSVACIIVLSYVVKAVSRPIKEMLSHLLLA